MQFHIFGAGSGIGRWFASRAIFSVEETFVYDIKKRSIDELRSTYGDRAILLDIKKHDYIKGIAGEFQNGDIIILAIPEESLESIAEQLSVHIPDDCAICVMTSRQVEPLALLRGKFGVSACFGLHPLFGPTVPEPHGQTVAICDIKSKWTNYTWFLSKLEKSGLSIVQISAEDHDKQMALIQALTHFTLITFADTINRSEFEWQDLMLLKTPPFQFLSAFASRILMATPATYAAIQKTAHAESARKALLCSAELVQNAIHSGNLDKYIEEITEIADKNLLASSDIRIVFGFDS